VTFALDMVNVFADVLTTFPWCEGHSITDLASQSGTLSEAIGPA
jgi:hypothetical protein